MKLQMDNMRQLFIKTYLFKIIEIKEGGHGLTVIVIRNRFGNQSLNPGQGYLHFTLY